VVLLVPPIRGIHLMGDEASLIFEGDKKKSGSTNKQHDCIVADIRSSCALKIISTIYHVYG